MAGCKKPSRSDQPSIKYRWNPVEGASIELADSFHGEYAPTLSDSNKQSIKKSGPKSQELLSTNELISAVDQIWDSANRLAVFQPKANLNSNHSGCQKKDILDTLGRAENGRTPLSAGGKYFCVNLRNAGQFSPMVQPNLEFLKVTHKMSVLESCRGNYTRSLFWRKESGLASVGMSYELGNLYQWMREIIPAGLKYPINLTEIENKRIGEYCIPEDTKSPAGFCVSEVTTSPASNLAIRSAECYSDLIKSKDALSHNNAKVVMNTRAPTSLCSDYFLRPVQDNKVDGSVSSSPNSSLYADYHIDFLASYACEECRCLTDDNELLENKRKQPEEFVIANESRMEIGLSASGKRHFVHAKQEHAFSGALAGIFVSLCLHPVDTVKTVIQSCRADQKSICDIGRSIVSERGLRGFYRGITSNIASSAPISAVYTFTYESVKGALLPLFPKEYYPLAHCMAGGCASVATSFIFTPSERIKQQMQVGSHYHNCWNALVGVIGRGGLPSLYAGWGAVLCRNVPHSIIKFYTYESLKQMMSSSAHSHAQPNTLQTLVCGGLAGSTAALFTTPFDVVKTRLQTQIPGSISQYNSVYHALQEIGKHEGLKGLYRGLIPRLVMYMSQGALFFSSYEFFKSLFSLEVEQVNAQGIQQKQNKEDDPGPPLSSSPPPPPPPPKLHSLHS